MEVKKTSESINTNFEVNSSPKSIFINNLLDYSLKKKISNETRERLFNLIGKEIEKPGIVETEILERLSKIEEMLRKKPEEVQDRIENTEPAKFIRPPHRPQETKSFLSLFNDSEGLKYLTHCFAKDKPIYEHFIELCKEEFRQAKRSFPNAAAPVLTRIENFAFLENPKWYIRKGKDKIIPQKGWSEPTFIEWYKKNENYHPWNNEKWKNEMIIPFKESIELRAGNLVRLINESIGFGMGESRNSFNLHINEAKINTAEFYTDVDNLGQALVHIFSTIKDVAEKNFCFDISVDYINETINGGTFKKIVITHINSEPTKNSNDPNFAKGDLKTIRNQLWRLCNYEINAKFPDGYKKKIILTDDESDYETYIEKNNSFVIENESSVNGFTHILKFY